MRINTFLIFISAFLVFGCTQSTIGKDDDHARKINNRFHNQMSLEEARKILLDYGSDIDFYNECLKQFEYPVTDCEKGYNRILTIPLPGHHWWLGKGEAQFYLYFDSDQRLIEHMYELYYPRHH